MSTVFTKSKKASLDLGIIPELLKLFDIKGSIVTIDAMGCQEKIAKTIIPRKVSIVLAPVIFGKSGVHILALHKTECPRFLLRLVGVCVQKEPKI